MRKYNSSFKTAFVSEAGIQLKNDDCFAYVEMDKYACFCIADGISDRNDAESAREAIDSIILQFQSAPSMSKQALRRYLKNANKEFLNKKSYEQLKASVTVVVTNYEKVRFAYAGNTRFRLFRDGRILHKTTDMSLSQDMADKELIREDMVAKHEERNNLFCYLGQKQFSPFISPKIKLQNADIIALYTRGIWENVSEIELEQIFKESGNEPKEECEKIEQFLIDKQNKPLENYTIVLIYVDKIFTDPNRSKRIKKIITISVIAAVLIIILCIVLFIFYKKRQENIAEMNQYIYQTQEYVLDENYARAKEECEKAIEAARKVKDTDNQNKMTQHLMLLEALLLAEDSFKSGKYLEAENLFLKARARSWFADNIGDDFIEKRLNQIERFRDVYDNIALGDKLLDLNSFEKAEEKYIQAKKDAAYIYFADGKEQAVAALERLYEKWDAAEAEKAALVAEQEAQAAERAADAVSAAELLIQGDKAYAEGDLEGAKLFYIIAQEKYMELEDNAQIAMLNKKILALDEKKEEVRKRSEDAALFEEQARIYTELGDYDSAKECYQAAKGIYSEIGKTSKADEVQSKIDLIDTKLKKQEKETAQAEKDKTVSGNNG